MTECTSYHCNVAILNHVKMDTGHNEKRLHVYVWQCHNRLICIATKFPTWGNSRTATAGKRGSLPIAVDQI